MKNRKRGQGIIEYVMLLMIPLLVIAVIPNLNSTVEMTLSTVGVDLLEEMGDVEVTCADGSCEIDPPITLHPPIAQFDLPKNCDTVGIYQKGRPVRLINASYDKDGDIDHLQWWITRKDVNGVVDTQCSTPIDDPIIVNRDDFDNTTTGLTMSGGGYGDHLIYGERECMRDPGSYEVTLRVYDNDGLVSQPFTKTFEIRDVRPSISISAKVSDYAEDSTKGVEKTITQKIVSDKCRFSPVEGLDDEYHDNRVTNNTSTGVPKKFVRFNGHDYLYIESCPYIEGHYDGIVTFTINNYDAGSSHGLATADPDFVAISHSCENCAHIVGQTFEGENNVAKNRHGFKYVSRFVSSVFTEEHNGTTKTIPTSTAEVTLFETAANVYTKQFKEAGTYLFDATVWDENQVSARADAEEDGSVPNVGVAVRVLSEADPDFQTKCAYDIPEKTCPKPQLLLAIDKYGNGDAETIYTSVGAYGYDIEKGHIGASNIDYNNFLDEGEAIPTSKYSKTINDLIDDGINYLNMDIYKTKRTLNGKSVDIPVFAPAAGERLRFRPLVYFGDNITYAHCIPESDDAYYYWATSDHYLNNFEFATLSHGDQPTVWNAAGHWGQVYRPYADDLSTPVYSASNMGGLIGIETYWNQTSYPIYNKSNVKQNIENGEILYTMAKNSIGTQKFSDMNPNPFAKSYKNANNVTVTDTVNEPVSERIRYDGNRIEMDDAQVRSNGQLFLIAPKQEMCPLEEQRPVPKLSIKANTVDIDGNETPVSVELTEDIVIEVDGTGDGVFSLNGEEYHIPCEANGCVVQVASEKSVCGTGAADGCVINGSRWEFDRVVTTGYPTLPTDDKIYYPNTREITKFTHTYYGNDSGKSFEANTTTSGTTDSIWDLPINENTYTYAYYGDYDNQLENPELRNNPRFDWSADNYLSTVAPHARSAAIAIKSTTNLEEGYNPTYKPDLFTNADGYVGYFIEAKDLDESTVENIPNYTYGLEIIDSQGCATSTTANIKVVKRTSKPVAYCNYIYHYVSNYNETLEGLEGSDWDEAYEDVVVETHDLLKNYEYYGGKMVQNIATFTDADGVYHGKEFILPIVIENGDYITLSDVYKPDSESEYTTHNGVRTSPLFMFSDFTVFAQLSSGSFQFNPNTNAMIGRNTERGDDAEFFTIVRASNHEAGNHFVSMYNKTNEYVYSDKPEDITYNPRTAQMLTGENVGEYLNAAGSIYEDPDNPLTETGDTGIKANWKIYKVDLKQVDSVRTDDIRDTWNQTDTPWGENLLNQQNTTGMATFNFYGAAFTEPTESNLVCTSNGRNLEDGPDCSGSQALNRPGYYIVKLKLDNTNMAPNDPNKYSNEIECRIKVKVPTLDFKCPWGETVSELKENAIEFSIEKGYDPTTGAITEVLTALSEEDIMAHAGNNIVSTDAEGNRTVVAEDVFVGNERITSMEVTPYMYEDPYRFDEEEKNGYTQEVIRFIDPSNPSDRYLGLKLNQLDGTYEDSLSHTTLSCSAADPTSCLNNYRNYLRTSSSIYGGFAVPIDANHIFQPLQLTGSYTGSSVPAFSWMESNCSGYDECSSQAITMPIELWLTKYHVGQVNKSRIENADAETNKEYDYLISLIRENINTEFYNDIVAYEDPDDEDKTYVDFIMEGMTINDMGNFSAVFLGSRALPSLSPEIEILSQYYKDIAEIIAYKYDKSVITWSDLQLTTIPNALNSIRKGKEPPAIANLYYGNIRKNISTDTNAATNTNPPSFVWGYEKYAGRSPFFGKYAAVKRFEAVNYFRIKEEHKASDYSAFTDKMESIRISPLDAAKGDSSKIKEKLYLDYKSVSLNQGKHIMENTNLGENTVEMSLGGAPLHKETINGFRSGLRFIHPPFNTLSLAKEKSAGWKTADNILKEVSYERGLNNSRLVYLRVNVESNNTNDYITYNRFNSSTTISVPNAYSKICPIVVNTKQNNVGAIACNLRSANMLSPNKDFGYESDGWNYYHLYADSSQAIASLAPYRLSGEKMLKFEHTDTGSWKPVMDLNNSKDMLLSARMAEATRMLYSFNLNGRTANISVDITPIDPENPLDSQFVEVQENFSRAMSSQVSSTFKLSQNDELSSISTIWITQASMNSTDCNNSSELYWENLLNLSDSNNTFDGNLFRRTYNSGTCHLRYDNSAGNTWYDILPLDYTMSFTKADGEALELEDGGTSYSCQMFTGHASMSPPTTGNKARIWIGDVENRVQYTGTSYIQHSDFSTYTDGVTRGPGVYPEGTRCFWEITGSGFVYRGSTYRLTNESNYANNPAVVKGDNDTYRFNAPYLPGAQIQETCSPIINGARKIYTNVDIRDPYDSSKVGFVVQRLFVHQNSTNQDCWGDQGQVSIDAGFASGPLSGTKTYCRAGTMYAVTTGDGYNNVPILGGLRGGDVFLALQGQNGRWSKILEYVDKKWGGSKGVWVYDVDY